MNRRARQCLVWALSQPRPVKARQELMSQPRLGSIKGNENEETPRCRAAHRPRLNATVLLTSLLFRGSRRRGSLSPTDTAYIYF